MVDGSESHDTWWRAERIVNGVKFRATKKEAFEMAQEYADEFECKMEVKHKDDPRIYKFSTTTKIYQTNRQQQERL